MSSIARAYRGNETLVWLCVVTFVNQLGFGSITPVVPLYARSFGVSVTAIGLAVAVYGLARFVGGVPTGQLSDRLGRRPTLVLGEIVTIIGSLLCGLAGDFTQFLLFRFIAGFGAVMVITTGQVIVADICTPANRGRMMAIYQGAFLCGVGLGPLPGGILAESFGLAVPFFSFAVLGVVAGAVALDKVPETRGIRQARDFKSTVPALSYARQMRLLLSSSAFTLVSLVTFVQFFARTGVIFAVLPIWAYSVLGLSADQIGTGMTISTLVNMAMVYFAGEMVDRFGRKAVVVPSTLASGIVVAAFAWAPSYAWFLVVSLFWGIAGGIGGPAPAAYAADVAPPGMNAVTMSSYRMVGDFGYVVGPTLLGWTADTWGSDVAIHATGLAFLVSGALFGLFAPETLPGRSLKRPT